MAARSRPRAGQLKDEIDEERSLWNQIKADGRKFDQLMARSDELQKRIMDLQDEQAVRIGRGDSPSARIDNELDSNLRENIKLSEEMLTLIKSERGNDICEQLTVLSALRAADTDSSTSRATNPGKSQRDRQNKRKLTDAVDERDSVAADSPVAPSPKIPSKDRLMQKSGSSRAGSVPAGRESSVKMEEENEHIKEAKHRLIVNTEVLYRNTKTRNPSAEGEGILCRVTSVIGEGKQRRYEIIDADPEPPTPSVPYRASVNHLVPIPPPLPPAILPDLKKGASVLALYPGTTTFYKAEVVAGWIGGKGNGIKKEEGEKEENLVRLRFEGEDEVDREMSVERRYVLPDRQ